jgi:hypothetical protein
MLCNGWALTFVYSHWLGAHEIKPEIALFLALLPDSITSLSLPLIYYSGPWNESMPEAMDPPFLAQCRLQLALCERNSATWRTFDKAACEGEARVGGITREANKQILLEVIDEDATYLGSKSFLVKNTRGKSAG